MGTRFVLAENVANEINMFDMLSSEVTGDGEIEIEYLGRCGNELVADCIEKVYRNDHLKLVRSNEADRTASYRLSSYIFEPCEGGIAVFDTEEDRRIWKAQV